MDRFKLRLPALVAAATFAATMGAAAPSFDTATPIGFFTNVAGRLLSTELNLDLSQIQVYPTNQYTPSVHRLLQVTANILDAENTNFYPSVFRPLFAEDASNNVFIIGYQQVTNVSGPLDPQLASPHDVTELLNYTGATPISDSHGPVNIYDVPWIVGAKQGLPNFNQLSLVNAAQITRKLEVSRSSADPRTATYTTNQMYLMGISNSLGISFWNSYSNAYPRPLTVFASDALLMSLSNGRRNWPQLTNFIMNESISSWPGSQWSGDPPVASPEASAFVSFNWPDVFESPLAYSDLIHGWDNGEYERLSQLDAFSLSFTNYLQAFILDGGNVIDYVQFCSPTSNGNLNQTLADPDYPQPGGVYYQWSTNASPANPATPLGVINQVRVSGNPNDAPPTGGQWNTAPTPMGDISPRAEAAFFDGFFTPTFQYNGKTYMNHELTVQAPYTPTRTVFTSFLLQANDPLVHYLAGDLNSQPGAVAVWNGRRLWTNGVWTRSDDPSSQPLPAPPATPMGGRYQPWGQSSLMKVLFGVDSNGYNLACKDPLVWGSDYWNFPAGQAWNLSWVGRVHRGTPWQTIFLKSTNVLVDAGNTGNTSQTVGINTWENWTGNFQPDDAARSAPVTDWHLVSVLAALLNTNDPRALFSVNNPDPNAWTVQLDGMIALTNTTQVPFPGFPAQLASVIVSSNSVQASIIADAIQSTKASLPGQRFQDIGDILATPELSVQSPFLNLNLVNGNAVQQEYGINDQAYEAIPSRLLPLLRADSMGKMVSTNGQIQVNFSGYDGQAYAIQVSSNLANWTNINTNSPVNGEFQLTIPVMETAGPQFYRSLWLP